MSGGRTSARELSAAAAVAAALHVTAISLDLPGVAPRTPDFLLTYPDGSTGVLEVTSVTTTSSMELDARLAALSYRLSAPGRCHWLVSLRTFADLRWVQDHAAMTVPQWEALGVRDTDELSLLRVMRRLPLDPVPDGVNFAGPFVDDTRPPQLLLHTAPISGVWDDQADVITPAVQEALLEQDNLRNHVDKLQQWPGGHRILFLDIHFNGLPAAATIELNPLEHAPSGRLQLPDGIEEIWLRPFTGRLLLRANAAGWQVVPAG